MKSKETIDLTVIIPVHSVSDPNFNNLLTTALTSINENNVIPKSVKIVRCGCGDVLEVLNDFNFDGYDFTVDIVKNTTTKDFQSQVNFGFDVAETEYVTFLEFDDEFSNNWLRNVKTYIESYPDVGMFLPIISEVTDDNVFTNYTNEAAWAQNFSQKLGFIDHETLLEYANISPNGMIVKKDLFKDVGGYKPNIKLTFNYEFLLRFTKYVGDVMVIPKIGYKHMNLRPGSLFWTYKNGVDGVTKITEEEAKFWLDTAREEFYYKTDRDVKYG